MLYFRMILTMLVSLYTSRVVLNTLGVEDYGTYTIVGGAVSMFGFLNGAMASATQRFLSFDLGREDYVQLRKTFNAAQITHFGIALLVLALAETVGLWFVKNYLVIPDGRMDAAIWVYHFTVLALMVTIIQTPYNAVLIARERMSVYAYISILEVLLKLLIVFMLTWIAYDKLKLYGVLLFGVTVIVATIYRIYTRRNFDETKLEVVRDRALYKSMISFSGWNLVGGSAMVLKGQGVSIVLNMFFGTAVNAAQGIANQVYGAIYSFVGNFQMASNPQIIKSYASENKDYMNSLIIRTSKFSFYLLFILTLPVILEIDYILKLWLKLVPDYTAVFAVLALINAMIDAVSGPLITTVQATGKVKVYQVVVGTTFILNLPLSYILLKNGFAPSSVYALNICITALVLIQRLFFVRNLVKEFSVGKYIKLVLIKNVPVVLLAFFIPFLLTIKMESGFARFLLVLMTSIASSVFAIYSIGLNSGEKEFVKASFVSLASKILK